MRLRTKALIVVVVFAIVVAAACGYRALDDMKKKAAEDAAAAQPVDAGEYGIVVGELNDKATELVGGQGAASQLSDQVAKWCSENVDGAKRAEWNQDAKCDFRGKSVELTYRLDDEKKTKVTVRAFPESGRYVIEKAVS